MKLLNHLLLVSALFLQFVGNNAAIVKKVPKKVSDSVPIVYNAGYGIGPMGTATLCKYIHPFDVAKASKVAAHLQRTWRLADAGDQTSHKELLEVHTPAYISALEQRTAETVAHILETPPLAKLPNWFVDYYVLSPMRKQTAGTLRATQLALQHGWAINLGGGFHHAKPNSGEGFCVYGDIQLAVQRYLREHPIDNVMIVDLDAHRGNGYAQAFLDESRVTIFDIYGGNNYPQQDLELCKRIDFNFPLEIGRGTHIDDAIYLGILKREFARAVDRVKPNLIVYNAGTDILAGDRLGGMKVSASGIVQRDAMVFATALDRGIPIVMLLSGGYTDESYKVIIDSIDNVLVLTGRAKA